MANQPFQQEFEIPTMRDVEIEAQPVLSDADVIRAGFDLIFQSKGEASVLTERALTPEAQTSEEIRAIAAHIRADRDEILQGAA